MKERINPAGVPGGPAAGAAPSLAAAVMPRPAFNADTGEIEIPTPFEGGKLRFDPTAKSLNAAQVGILQPARIKADYPPMHVAAFLADCHRRGLDPWSGEVYLLRYKTSTGTEYIRHIGIYGFLRKAQEADDYRGLAQVMFQGDGDGKWREVWPYKDAAPFAARVAVRRAGGWDPDPVIALYDEYAPLVEETERVERNGEVRKVPTGRGKVPTPMWRPSGQGGKPTIMLGKCVRAAALRLEYTPFFGGFYEPAETERLAAQGSTSDYDGGELAEQRRAAYAAAQAAKDSGGTVVDGADVGATVRETITITPPAAGGREHAEQEVRALLLAELDAQARILGKDRAWMTRRWSATRGGQEFETASVATITGHVQRFRAYLVEHLRETGRHRLATTYAAAPVVGTLEALFGTAEPWADDPAEQAAAGDDADQAEQAEQRDLVEVPA